MFEYLQTTGLPRERTGRSKEGEAVSSCWQMVSDDVSARGIKAEAGGEAKEQQGKRLTPQMELHMSSLILRPQAAAAPSVETAGLKCSNRRTAWETPSAAIKSRPQQQDQQQLSSITYK